MRLLVRSARNSLGGVTLAQATALVLPVVIVAQAQPSRYAILLVTALLSTLIWEAVFAALRKYPFSFHGLTTALIFVVMIPPTLPLWQLVLMLSLGVILGELIFGGRGYGFINPAVVALCLLVFSFPQVQLPPASQSLALAVVPGAVWLLLLGLISARVIAGTVLGIVGLMFLGGTGVHILTIGTALGFGLIFLICDPTGAAATNPGRWIYGVLAGGLIILFSGGQNPTADSVVFAAITASVFAPLIDHLVVLGHAKWRGVAHG
ncbi:MAG: RnfABCDGE type electron transport complex subunit D [Yoonia sp.]|nr:RnfABCDGE type electron transport complex subunit D [Yoonia sp.]